MSGFRLQSQDGPDDPAAVHQVKVHGGIGDIIWCVGKKLVNADKPLFLHISEENRHRPRRSGILADHLPRVAGWRFDGTTFAPGGKDWTQSADDPACALDVTWAEVAPDPGEVIRLECNRHLEMGRRLEDWLPDLPTTHHFAFRPAAPPGRKFEPARVVFHLAGWPDVPDSDWVSWADLFSHLAPVYLVGGSYDGRPRRVYEQLGRKGRVTLLEDVGWGDLVGVLDGCDYVFGHASGFTALADVLQVRGAIINPRSVPHLTGTWNSPENRELLYVPDLLSFRQAVAAAYQAVRAGDRAVWPPSAPLGNAPAVGAGDTDPLAPARAVGAVAPPSPRVYVRLASGTPAHTAAAVLAGAYDAGVVPVRIDLAAADPAAVTAVFAQAARTSRPPAVTVLSESGLGRGPYDLLVLHTGTDTPAAAAQAARTAWGTASEQGLLVVAGQHAEAALRSVAGARGAAPAAVRNSSGWWFLRRRA